MSNSNPGNANSQRVVGPANQPRQVKTLNPLDDSPEEKQTPHV